MKIGQFAKKYDINITTVRYYIERSLLTPERKNNQYIFNEECMRDMEKILRYKEYRFSLEEIELLFFLEKTSNSRDEDIMEIISDIFEDKKTMLEDEIDELKETVKRIDEERDSLQMPDGTGRDVVQHGIPLSFMPFLRCPKCGSTFALGSADIADDKISKGTLICSCGYNAVIKDGIIFSEGYTEDTPFKVFDNIESVLQIADEYSASYRMLIDQTYMWMYHTLVAAQGHRLILAGPFTTNFLLKYCHNYNENTTLIVIDPSLKKLLKMRKYMGDCAANVVYIAGSIDSIPMKEGCVDAYIDDFSVTDCIFTYNRSIYKKIAPLIRSGGAAIGIFGDYKTAPETLRNFRQDHPDFDFSKMNLKTIKSDLATNGMRMDCVKIVGRTSGNDRHFPRNVMGEQVTILGYKAVKERTGL